MDKDGHDYIPYIKTGVIGGKWYHPVMDLFKKHNIQVDFSKRGFYEKNKKRSLYDRIKTKKVSIALRVFGKYYV